MKTLRKISALVLVIMMIAVVGTAWAATTLDEDVSLKDGDVTISAQGVLQDGEDKGDDTAGVYKSVGNTVTIEKDIIVFNSSVAGTKKTVHYPNVSYTYTISQVGTEATVIGTNTKITDEYSLSANVFGSVLNAVTNTGKAATVAFSDSDTVSTDKGGTVISKTFDFTFDPSKFPHAGVYRYLITETEHNTSTRQNADVIQGADYNNTRYLDVYVMNNSAGTGLEIYGYVLFEGANNTAITTTKADSIKTNGYVVNDETDLTDTSNCDYYWTVNLDVKKLVTGQLGDKQHEFPFSIALTSPVTSFAKADYSDTSTNTTSGTTAFTNKAATVTCTLNDQSIMSIIGLPVGTTVIVTETNNTYDTYTASAEHDNSVTLTVNTKDTDRLAKDANGAVNSLTIYNTTDNADPRYNSQIAVTSVTDTIDTITLTNDISAVSPTGYVTRFAPYALILVGGIVLLIIAKKRKPAKDDEE